MKRLLHSLTTASLVALLLFVGGCDITSLNDNPNQPTAADPPKLLANAQIDIADQYWQDYAGGFWVRYAQYWTTNQYTDADRYRYASSRPGALNALWENYYLALNDLQEIKRLNRENPSAQAGFGSNANQIAIASIMQAWTLKTMTDMWGPIPLADALQGRSQGNFTPTYNSQEEVYNAILDTLTQASNNITGGTALAGGDVMYGGDMSKWKKFANSLKMRVAITMADADPGTASTAIEEALNAGVFTSNDDNALIAFNSAPPYQNPFFENYEVAGRDDWAAPASILDVMNDQNDPRRTFFFSDATPDQSGEQFVGFPYGLSQGDAQSLFTSGSFSRPSAEVSLDPSAPAIMMLYDEVLFIQAEAAFRNATQANFNVPSISAANGTQLYRDAVAASAEYWGVSSSNATSFANSVPAATSGNYKQVLGTQKWIAQYLQGVPGWTTFRRLDFTGVLSPPDGDPGQDQFGRSFPTRMVYPTDESSLNEENLNAAISNLLGGNSDNQGVLLWWDTSPPPNP